MYDRYGDISKFITDPDKLELAENKYVCISCESDYDIAVGLDGCYGSFDEVKPFIAFVAEHINELDNIVQKYDRRNSRNSAMHETPFDLYLISLKKPNHITLEYYCTDVNSEFNTVFEYKDGSFHLRSFGTVKNIPDDWESSQ